MRHGLSVVEVDPDFIGAAAPARPTASSATRATPTPRSGSRTWRRIRRASTTAPTPSSASRSSLRTGPRWARSCACAAGRPRPSGQGPEQRLPARERVHAPDREVRQLHEAELLPRSYGRQPCQGVAIPLRPPGAGRLAADRRASAAQGKDLSSQGPCCTGSCRTRSRYAASSGKSGPGTSPSSST
jgi:hypothetical protein